MDFAKLKAFIVVAEELNFRKSAEILGMSQPPLTRLIATLEEELGARLFERTTRQVRLTGAGLLLLKEAREITAALERIKTDIRFSDRAGHGSLKIAFSATAFLARFPVILEEFQNRFPKIKLDLQQSSCKEILKGIRDGRYDVGFVEGITSFPQLSGHVISEEALGVLLPKKHFLTKRKEIEFRELENETIILHHKLEAEEFYGRITRLIKGLKRKPKVYIKGENESCPILVATHKGVALTIEGSQRIVPEGTRFVPIKEMFLPVHAFWDEENTKPSLQMFLSAAIENSSLTRSKTHCLSISRAT